MIIEGLVSVIMPAFNAEKTIASSVESVINQTYTDWELIIVDDCSTDNTLNIITAYKDDRIIVLHNEINVGPAMSWNRAFEVMRGRWVAFLDADDLWTEDKLKDQLEFAIKNGYEYTFTSYDWIDAEGNPLNKIVMSQPNWTYKDVLKNPIIGNSTVMLDRTVIDIPVLPNVRYNNDACLRGPISKAGHVAHGLPGVYMHYRIMPNSVSRNKIKAAKNVWIIYKEVHHLPLYKRLYYFSCYAWNSVKKYYLHK